MYVCIAVDDDDDDDEEEASKWRGRLGGRGWDCLIGLDVSGTSGYQGRYPMEQVGLHVSVNDSN